MPSIPPIKEDKNEPNSYIGVTKGMRGYFAVLISKDECGDYWPHHSGIGSYSTAEGAAVEAREWALSEGIPFHAPQAPNKKSEEVIPNEAKEISQEPKKSSAKRIRFNR